MKFAFKFSMPKWERPKQEAPYYPNPIISELEKIDFASLTAERRQDVLHRLKRACADIAEDRRHQPAILSDRIRLQKMWQDYFRIAQTVPAGDDQGESLSISRYAELNEEEHARPLGAVMTMQEELVAAANFKIDLGGMDMNDLDDFDDFSASSIPRTPAPPPPPAPKAETAAAKPKAKAASTDDEMSEEAKAELVDQMAKIKTAKPLALPMMEFPTDHTDDLVVHEGDEHAHAELLIMAHAEEDKAKAANSEAKPEEDSAHDEEWAAQMAKIKAVKPLALPMMEFPTDHTDDLVEHEGDEHHHAALIIEEHVEPKEEEHQLTPEEELAQQMARIKAAKPIGLPPIPHPAEDKVKEAQAQQAKAEEPSQDQELLIVAEAVPDIELTVTEAPLTLTIDAPMPDDDEPVIIAKAEILSDHVEPEQAIIRVDVQSEADASGFRPLTLPTAEPQLDEAAAPEPVAETKSEPEPVVAERNAPAPAVEPEVMAEAVALQAPEPVIVPPQAADTQEPEAKEAKPKKSKKASALATLRSMLSGSKDEEPAKDATVAADSAPVAPVDAVAPSPTPDPEPVVMEAPVEAAAEPEALPEPETLPEPEIIEPQVVELPKEREVSATPSTKEWVNIKLLRPSVIRGLPLPDQVITIVPYSEAKRLEENGSAIILTKPRTPK